MKKLLIILAFFAAIGTLRAQVENPGDAAKNGATDHVNNNIQNGVDNTLNGAENSIKGLFKKKKKPAQQPAQNQQQAAATNTNPANAGTDGSGTATIATYKNYDFVPGDKVIFQSELGGEQVGEIPSQLTIQDGQLDIQTQDNDKVVRIPKGAGATFAARMTNQAYMPDQFTVEFDVKNERFGINHFTIKFGTDDSNLKEAQFGSSSVAWTTGDVTFPEQLNVEKEMTWHHVAIAVNKNVGKVYIDQFRVANVNNLAGKATNVTFEVNGYENSFIKNIRIAAGGINIYKAITTDAKIVTHGILFDVNKATIRPESMGTINNIYDLLKNSPSLRFEIDGHTDNSGTPAGNLTLSQERADAVKIQLISMGIDGSRLTTKGFGDTKPIAENTTPEGMANNRRVEFVKM